MDRERIKEVLDQIYETDALIVKAAADDDLSRCQKDLALIGVPLMPQDVLDFLGICNGAAWNGFEFFGTFQVTVRESGYTLKDLITANEEWHQRKMGLSQMLVLGRFDDDLFVYDKKENQYLALDQLTLSEVDRFESFEELFVISVSAYLDYDDEDFSLDDEE